MCHKNRYLNSITSEYQSVIDEYLSSNEIRFWENVEGDTVAYGEVVNRIPKGIWKVFKNNQVVKDGQFVRGQKHGTWNWYKIENTNSKFYSVKSEIQKDVNCKELRYWNEYENGKYQRSNFY